MFIRSTLHVIRTPYGVETMLERLAGLVWLAFPCITARPSYPLGRLVASKVRHGFQSQSRCCFQFPYSRAHFSPIQSDS